MTLQQTSLGNAVALHLEPERFQVFAQHELDFSAPWRYGICFQPECSKAFLPNRDWQIYCCTTCERAATTEMRKWGHKMALAQLTRRMTKYGTDSDVIDLTRAARRYTGHVSSAWLLDRQRRMALAGANQ